MVKRKRPGSFRHRALSTMDVLVARRGTVDRYQHPTARPNFRSNNCGQFKANPAGSIVPGIGGFPEHCQKDFIELVQQRAHHRMEYVPGFCCQSPGGSENTISTQPEGLPLR
jgi:hypothetical protein